MLSTAWLWSPPSVAPTSPAPRPARPRFLVGDVPSCYIMFHHVPRYANLPTSFGLWANATPWPCWFFSPSVRFWNLLLLSSRTLWLPPPYCKTLTSHTLQTHIRSPAHPLVLVSCLPCCSRMHKEVPLSLGVTSSAKHCQEVLAGSHLIPRRRKTQGQLRRKKYQEKEEKVKMGHEQAIKNISRSFLRKIAYLN